MGCLFFRAVIPGWRASARPGISRFRVRCFASPRNDGVWLDQILPGDDLAKPRIVRDEFLDEFVDAMLENVIHVAVLEAVADAAGVALRGALAAIGDADLVEIAHEVAVAARQRARQRVV